MPTNRLTDHQCRMAKPIDGKEQKLFDGGGLYLWISGKGVKVWRQAYRLHGRPQTATHGEYPLITLAEARDKRDGLKKTLLAGESPKRKAPAGQLTLVQASEQYWDGRKDVTERYRNNAKRGIALHLPKLLQRPIGTITRDDLMAELLVTDAAGKHVYVRKVRMWVGHVFDWAVEHSHAEMNPAALINPKRAFSHARVVGHAALHLRDLHSLLERVDMEGDLVAVMAMRLLALTWTRTQELRFWMWDEIDGDLWEIPEGKMKRRHAHLVPLPRQALELLAKMKARGRGSKYVFPAEHRLDRPISENAILALLYRVGYKGQMTGHGFRTVASTWANERQFNPDAIERQLSHVPENKVRATYNKALYLPIRRRILQDWADWLDDADAGGAQGGSLPATSALA